MNMCLYDLSLVFVMMKEFKQSGFGTKNVGLTVWD